MARMLAWGASGRWFESSLPDSTIFESFYVQRSSRASYISYT